MNLTEGSVKTHLKRIAIPASIAFFFSTLFNVVDTFFAGMISTIAQTALSLSFPVFFIVIALINGISTSTSALVGNAIGENDSQRTALFKAQAIVFAIFLAFLGSFAGYYIAPWLFRIMGAHGEALTLATKYMRIVFLGSFFPIISYSFHGIFIAYGEARPLRNWLIFASILNALLNPVLIFGMFGLPVFGFQGIAYATVFCMATGSFYMGSKLIREGYLKELSLPCFYPNFQILKELSYQIVPASLNMMAIAIGIFVVTRFVQIFSDEAVAGFGIGTRIQQLFLLPVIGISTAALAVVGQNNGARKLDRVTEAVHLSFCWASALLFLGSFTMFFASKYLMRIFTRDLEVIEIGINFLKIGAITCWTYMGLVIYTAALQGLKRAHLALLVGFIRQVLLPILLIPLMLKLAGHYLETIWATTLGINAILLIFAWFLFTNVLKFEKKELLK